MDYFFDSEEDFIPEIVEEYNSSDDDNIDENNVKEHQEYLESDRPSIFLSKDQTITWTTVIPNTYGRSRAENIIRERGGIHALQLVTVQWGIFHFFLEFH